MRAALVTSGLVAGLLVLSGCSGSGDSGRSDASGDRTSRTASPSPSASCKPADASVDASPVARTPLPSSGRVSGQDLIARLSAAYKAAATSHFTTTTVEAGSELVRASGDVAYDACDDSFSAQFSAEFGARAGAAKVDARVIRRHSFLNTGTPFQGRPWLAEPGVTVDQATTTLDGNVRHLARDADPQQLTYAWITHAAGVVGARSTVAGVAATPVTVHWTVPLRAGDLSGSYARLAGQAKTWRLTTTVWLDERNHLVESVHQQTVGRYSSTSTTTFSGWGASVHVVAPPPDQTLAAPGS